MLSKSLRVLQSCLGLFTLKVDVSAVYQMLVNMHSNMSATVLTDG